MIGRRQIRPPAQADASFVLVEFTEDGEFEIYTEDKVKKTSLGLFLAPYGPHKVDYPCRIIQLSSNKAELLKMKNEYVQLRSGKDGEFTNNEGMRDDGHNESEGETSDEEIEEIQKTKKNQPEHADGKKEKGKKPVQNKVNQQRIEKKRKKKIIANQETKQEEQQKKNEEKEQKKQEMLKMREEKEKKKVEQQRKKEARQLKKKEQEQKKQEKQKRKEEQEKTKALLLQRNQSIMEQIADFEEPDTWDLASTSQQEPQYDNFTADVVDESVSFISSCQQIMQEAPLEQNVQRPQVHQNPNKKPHPTTGKKYPRKQFMLKTASRKVSEGPNAKKVTTPELATYTSSYSQVPIACSRNSQLPEVCNNCTVLLKELEDARYQIQTLKQKLEEHGGENLFNGNSTEEITHVMTNPRAGRVSKSVADLYQMIELVPGTRIYVYQNQLDKAMTRDSPTARARCIIMAFYTPEELVEAANLSGANEKRGLDPDIVDAVIGFSVKEFGDTKKSRNEVKASLRRKLTAMSSEKKRQQDSALLEMESAKRAKK